MDIVKGKIGNALTSAASNHVVATANDIYDESIGKYQNEINNDLQGIVENGALINGLQLDLKPSDPNYLGIEYIYYVDKDHVGTGAIELPLATGDNGGIISKDCYNYIHGIRRDTIINSPIHISEDTNGIKLEFNTRTNNTIEPVTKYIPFASTTSGGIISADLYKYLYNLQNGAILINPLEISQATSGLTLKYSSRRNNSINSTNVNIPLASDTKNGVLSKEDYVALHNLIDNSSSSTDSPYGEYPLTIGQSITFENVNGSLNMKWSAISPGGEPFNNEAVIPVVNRNCSGLMPSSSYLHLNNLLDAHLVKDVNVVSTYKKTESDTTTQAAIEITKYSSITPTKTTLPIPAATSTSSGVMTPAQVAFIEYNQGHNTCDDFADIPANKHICLVDLTGIAAAEGETSKALTVVMEGTGEYDGAEVLLYCHHDGTTDLGIGVPASSTNGAEYVLIPNNGEQDIYAGIQELDFVLSCTYINNKWYVRKA